MNAVETISKVTGMSKPEVDSVFQEVKANQRKLESCIRPHDFSICLDRRTKQPIDNPTPQQHFGAKWQCSKCDGIVDSIHKINYNQGLKDAKL